MTDKHPLDGVGIAVYKRISNGGGPSYLAKFEPYKMSPMLFSGATEEVVVGAARKFADEAVAKHGAAFEVRAAALRKAREARAAKAAGGRA